MRTIAASTVGGLSLLACVACGRGAVRPSADSPLVEGRTPVSCALGGGARLMALDSLVAIMSARSVTKPSEMGWPGLDRESNGQIRDLIIPCKTEAIAQLIVSPDRITDPVAMDLSRLFRASKGSAAVILEAYEQQGRPERLLDVLKAAPRLQAPADRDFVRALVLREIRSAAARWRGDSNERLRRVRSGEGVTLSHIVAAGIDILAPSDVAAIDSLLHDAGMDDMRPGE